MTGGTGDTSGEMRMLEKIKCFIEPLNQWFLTVAGEVTKYFRM